MHAYLIIAHKNENQLKKLLQLLDNKNNDIFIHIDKKAALSMRLFDYRQCCKYSNVYQYSEYRISWGSFSIIECELFLMEQAAKVNKYQYYHLLSGLDLPICTQKEIHDFFDKHSGMEFILFSSCQENSGALVDDRVKYYWASRWYDILPTKKSLSIMRKLDNIQVKIQKLFGINRLNGLKIDHLFRGAQWFSITDNLVRDILNEKKNILSIFKASKCCDEVFLQTFIKTHTEYEGKIYGSDLDDYDSIKREIDWNRGGPYTWRLSDYDEIMSSNNFFARKFDETVDSEIINQIYQTLMEKEKMEWSI